MILPPTRQTAMHEAHHAAALCLFGMPPLVVRCDWPEERRLGWTQLDWKHNTPDRETLCQVLVATLMGPVAEGQLIDSWPIDVDEWCEIGREDAEQVAFLADVLTFDVVDWHHAIFKAQRLAKRRDYAELVVAIATELERSELLLQPEVERLARQVMGRRDG